MSKHVSIFSLRSVADPENFGRGDDKNFKLKTPKNSDVLEPGAYPEIRNGAAVLGVWGRSPHRSKILHFFAKII